MITAGLLSRVCLYFGLAVYLFERLHRFGSGVPTDRALLMVAGVLVVVGAIDLLVCEFLDRREKRRRRQR